MEHLTAHSLSSAHPVTRPAASWPTCIQRSSRVFHGDQAVGWSQDIRGGMASTQGTTDFTSRETRMWPSPHCPPFPEWRKPPLALPTPYGRIGAFDSGPLTGWKSKACVCVSLQAYSDSLGISGVGLPSLRLRSSPDTWTDDPGLERGAPQTM